MTTDQEVPVDTEAAPTDAPVEEAPVTDAPVEETPGTEVAVPDWGARVTEWGGEEKISEALGIYEALATREGVEALFQEAGRALGVGDDRLKALFGEPVEEAAPAADDPFADPDRLMTAAEVKELLERDVLAPQRAQQQEAAERQVAGLINSYSTEIGVPEDQQTRMLVLNLADQFLPNPDVISNDPAAIRAAISKGWDAYQAAVQKSAEAYLKQKADQANSVPSPLSGGATGGGDEPAEPTSLAEAKERVRRALGQS